MFSVRFTTARRFVVAMAVFAAFGSAVSSGSPDRDKGDSKSDKPKTAQQKPDDATIAKLIEDLGGDRLADWQKASRALEGIGEAALPALRRAARSESANLARRAQALAAKIEDAAFAKAAVESKSVHLRFKDAPLEKVVEEFRNLTGYDIALHEPNEKLRSRKVTLDTGSVNFWTALDLLCASAGLEEIESPPAPPQALAGPIRFVLGGGAVPEGVATHLGRVRLRQGKPKTLPTSYAGVFRLKILPAKRSFPAQGADGDQLSFSLEISQEPKTDGQVSMIRIDKAIDDQGQSLGVQDARVEMAKGVRYHRYATIRLVEGAEPAKVLREIRGTLFTQAGASPEPIATVDDVLKAKGNTYETIGGSTVTILSAARESGLMKVQFELLQPAEMPRGNGNEFKMLGVPGSWFGLAVLDAEGQPVRDVKMEMIERKFGKLGGSKTTYALEYRIDAGKPPSRLVLLGRRRINVTMPFVLKDVPVP